MELKSALMVGQGVGLAVVLAADGVLACMSLYLLALAVASFFARKEPDPSDTASTRFAVLIPAHNEQLLLGALLRSLSQVKYATELFDVHVVADNCDDRTAQVAAEAGVNVHERTDPSERGKGYALNWLLDRLLDPGRAGTPYDAFVVLDADSTVPPDFLAEMAAALSAGNPVVQGFNDIANPTESWTASLRYIAFCLICYLRRRGMSALGLSVGLLGNGMCLSRGVVEQFRWDARSVTEDHELHVRLLEAGLKVAFAPRAHVYSQMPATLRSARSQNVRWEQGKLRLLGRYTMRLLLNGLRTRNWSMLAVAMEMSIPPFSLVFAATLAALAVSVVAQTPMGVALAAFSVLAQLFYTLRGLAIMPVRSARVYRAILYVPWFIAWKSSMYAAVLLGSTKPEWVRTARTEANESA